MQIVYLILALWCRSMSWKWKYVDSSAWIHCYFANFFTKVPVRTAECECIFSDVFSLTQMEILKLKISLKYCAVFKKFSRFSDLNSIIVLCVRGEGRGIYFPMRSWLAKEGRWCEKTMEIRGTSSVTCAAASPAHSTGGSNSTFLSKGGKCTQICFC